LKKICHFSKFFFGDGDYGKGERFSDLKFIYSIRVLYHVQNLKVSNGVIGEKFFLKIGTEAQQVKGSKNFMNFFPLKKFSYVGNESR
jgi:hypothetical protein